MRRPLRALPTGGGPRGWVGFFVVLLALSAPAAADQAARACPALPLVRLGLPATHQTLRADRPLTIVAFGSSSTAGSGASSPAAAYPAQLERALRATFPGHAIRVLNRGIGGENAAAMLARLDSDALAERPRLVLWQVGGNDALRGDDPAQFRRLLSAGIARLRASGADVVLIDNQRAPRIAAAPTAPVLEATTTALAAETGIGLLPRGRLMDAWAAAGMPHHALLVDDGLHHNDRGYACLAEALAEAIAAAVPTPARANPAQRNGR